MKKVFFFIICGAVFWYFEILDYGLNTLFKDAHNPDELVLTHEQPAQIPLETLVPTFHEPPPPYEPVDHTARVFSPQQEIFSFIKTVTYTSRPSWRNGRSCWMSDYAKHYKTSPHFISRSLHGSDHYLEDTIREGDRINVLRTDLDLAFHLDLDFSSLILSLWAIDRTNQEETLIKTYKVCGGRRDPSKASGHLTPFGLYTLGDRIAQFEPGKMGLYKKEQVELITVFGTRWIPFGIEIEGCTESARGFGIHGVPWIHNETTLAQDPSSIDTYQSDGCIRLLAQDLEELYAIITSRPATIEIRSNFSTPKRFNPWNS